MFKTRLKQYMRNIDWKRKDKKACEAMERETEKRYYKNVEMLLRRDQISEETHTLKSLWFQ
jgi:hypothetical protein